MGFLAWGTKSELLGCLMKSYKAFPFLILVACVFLGSCSGLPKGNGCSGSCGGTANVSLVLVSDTPPATLGLISFKVVPTAITLTPSTGTATTFNINNGTGYSYDLVRLQSDTGFVATVPSVPTGTLTSVAVTFSGATLAFFNGTGLTISNLSQPCLNGTVCVASFVGPFTSTITTSQAITGNAGLGIDVNLANCLTLSGSTLTLNFGNTVALPVTTTFALPRANSNLATGQLALIEDITGVVSNATNAGVTVTPSASLMNAQATAALTNASTNYDPDPTNTLCPSGTTVLTSCVSNGQAASMDAILNTDGTFTIREIEPLLPNPIVDTVEGTVYSVASSTNPTNLTQFSMIITNLIPAATNSLIGSLSVGSKFTVNVANSPTPFSVDTKGLLVANCCASSYGSFANATDTTAIHLGQTVAVHVTLFTAASGTTPASSTVSTATLRWTRFTANTAIAASGTFTINALPGHFGFTQGITFVVQTFTTGSQGADGITNLEGFPGDTASLTVNSPVAMRALYFQNPGNTLNPAFFAAKVRQH
jgi:hypothetical protein